MDYPKSVANVGLVDGKFVDENTATGSVGSLIPSEWGNAVTDEILGVIQAAGLDPAEADTTQLIRAIRQLGQVGASTYSTDTGSANTYKAAFTPAVTTLKDGMVLRFKVKTANTGVSTFAPDALAAKPIVSLGHADLAGGELIANGRVAVQYNATLDAWVLLSASGGSAMSGRLIGVQVFTASGVYTPTPGTKSVVVEGVGGGGASGGAAATSSSQVVAGGGATAGAYGKARFNSGFSGVTVTIGAAGIGGNGAGPNGGATSFGSLMTLPGGPGAPQGSLLTSFPSVSGSDAGPSSAPTGANIAGSPGQSGGNGVVLGLNVGFSGQGGASQFGAPGWSLPSASAGTPASGYGAGGGGGVNAANSAARIGGNGSPGILIVLEYA